ncbi:MAG: sugar phosphate isomerase/epimerase [Alicyclobacillus sp.]|nr:sugar phosphate isomerase/epimerase [Alicyclobacillus sp.]
MTISIGCQTYTWQMSYSKYVGEIPHILDIVQRAGFTGFEPEVCMLGKYYDDPGLLRYELDKRSLRMGALCLALEWLYPEPTAYEVDESQRVMRYLKHFPGAALILVQLPGKDRSNLSQRQKNALGNINRVAKMAYEHGIVCAFHPNSPSGSVFRTKEDYQVLLEGINHEHCGFAPDTGHIVRGGMDVMDVLTEYRSLIRHIHFKDIAADGSWTSMGKGVIDHPAIARMLQSTGYKGWIMVEEESKRAESAPDEVTIENGSYVKQYLFQINL